MRISPVRYNTPSFGYDKRYHDWVKEELHSECRHNETAKALLDMENMSLSLEDRLIAIEKRKYGVDTPKYEIIADCLVSLKSNIAFYMHKYFPYFDYMAAEIEQYGREMNEHSAELEYYWREAIYSDLNDTLNKDVQDEKEYEDSAFGIPLNNIDTSNSPQDTNSDDSHQQNSTTTQTETKEITKESISGLLTEFHPTASSPKSFDDVVGIETTKQQLQEDIIDYIENPELKELDKQEYGIEASSTILFYGPPGCGKTYITEALASQSGLKMFKIDISKIGSKYVNQTSGNIQKAFDYIAQVAKEEDKPVLLFVDELDSLAISRESMKGSSGENLKTTSTLLKLIQEAKDKNIIIIGATNKRGLIDAALLDRFGTETYFGLPDKEAIKKLLIAKLGKITKGQNLAKDDESIDELAESLQGYSNRTIVHITQEAAKLAKRNSRSDITFEIFNQAIEQCEHEKIDEKTYRKESARKIGFI